MVDTDNTIDVQGARVHNLKNIDISIPREQLVVITGLSGSGKSSLAFDTIYAEGQRRYVETFSAYARQFLGGLERPDVDKIDGLSPVIAIEQKTTSKSPRSTVGTITEIYDFLRLLYARGADAYSYNTGEKMVSYSDEQIKELITQDFTGKRINILAPIIRARKGHYAELFQQITKQGFLKVRVNGEIQDLVSGMKLDRYKTHDIEIVVDRLVVDNSDDNQKRLSESINTAMHHGENVLMVLDQDSNEVRYFSRNLMCPTTGISYQNPEPNLFSFNSPKGACAHCNGLGTVNEINRKKIIPNPKLSIKNGGFAPLGEYKSSWIFKQLEIIGEKYGFKLTDAVETISEEAMEMILNGGKEKFTINSKDLGVAREYKIDFEGIAHFIKNQYDESGSSSIKRWAKEFMDEVKCPECEGSRLKKEALFFKVNDKNIAELSDLDISDLTLWFQELESHLSDKQKTIATEVIKEIKDRLDFLMNVGLNYLALSRSSKSLSGGEAQRIRLATQIGSQLVGVLYILDEPSIGLHQRDNERLEPTKDWDISNIEEEYSLDGHDSSERSGFIRHSWVVVQFSRGENASNGVHYIMDPVLGRLCSTPASQEDDEISSRSEENQETQTDMISRASHMKFSFNDFWFLVPPMMLRFTHFASRVQNRAALSFPENIFNLANVADSSQNDENLSFHQSPTDLFPQSIQEFEYGPHMSTNALYLGIFPRNKYSLLHAQNLQNYVHLEFDSITVNRIGISFRITSLDENPLKEAYHLWRSKPTEKRISVHFCKHQS
mgnify:CR=1 FL=1